MKRRHALAGLCAAALLGSAARAQQPAKLPRVGYLFSFVPSEGAHLWEACRQGLRDLGYVEGKNIVLEPRWAEGRHDRMPALVAELVRLKVDVIVAAATPAGLAAKAGAGSIPVVMVAVGEPVKVGLVASLQRPGGSITGLTLLTPDLSGKRLQLLVEVLGRTENVALLLNPDNRSHEVFLAETQAAAASLGVRLLVKHARKAEDIESAFMFPEARPDGVIVFDDPVLWSFRKQIVSRASRANLPVAYGYSEFVDDGGLMSLGPDRIDHYRRTARYVDRILKGARPAEMPVERPTKFEMVINVRTARALGITIPPSIFVRADRVIE